MNHDEHPNDSTLTRELHDSLSELAVPGPPPLAAIISRGRVHQRRRRAGFAGRGGTGAAAGIALALGQTGADVHTTTPGEQILSRGRAVRARRRISTLAAALAVAVGAAVAVTALLPASHPASHQPAAQLTAWTVVKRPDGDISVTIRELFHPAGLQRKLRADGVPASVTFYPGRGYPSSCRPYRASRALLKEVFPSPLGAPTAAIVIRPSAVPTGTAVYIDDFSNPYGYFGIRLGLVHASKRCTGS
jgi:hypothetical protein